MAYTNDRGGPYPCLKDEYCGNFLPEMMPVPVAGESPEEAKRAQERWLALMRFGRPRATENFSTAELELKGLVGLYLKEDRQIMPWDKPVSTPDELREPPGDG